MEGMEVKNKKTKKNLVENENNNNNTSSNGCGNEVSSNKNKKTFKSKKLVANSTDNKKQEEKESVLVKNDLDINNDIININSDKLFINNKNVTKKNNEEKVITDLDEYLFKEGTHINCYKFMGSHYVTENKKKGFRFTTWAPKASKVTVVGDFSNWKEDSKYEMIKVNESGLWSLFIPGLKEGMKYKFSITNEWKTWTVLKADPYAFKSELRPNTASILIKKAKYRWGDKKWLNKREKINHFDNPMNIYELHLGSWKTNGGKFLSYDEISKELPKYIKEMGYTHVEIMPVNEHPLDASWGYQITGYYSPSSRFGDSKGLKNLINSLHKEDIGVIFDWVPSHFCKDEHGLSYFDGNATYEYAASWKADNKGWGTSNFDLGRPEVRSFLISNAVYWISEFHIDGLRVDAVSNMLYLDYGRSYGEWEPNVYGQNGNLEAIEFLKNFNTVVKTNFPGVITIAEESTSWAGITRPVEDGGLGFDFKWNMGWMNDTLRYIEKDPIHRKYHHHELNFSMVYNYSEKFILPISHDEVVHGKGSLIAKMPGDNWNKYAGLRLYSAFMMGHPGKKLLFMGSEFGQFVEWQENQEIQWHVIDKYDIHKKTHNYFKELNKFYLGNKALWECDYDPKGFEWIDADNAEKSILTFIRRGKSKEDTLVFICNFTPVVYYDFEVGVTEEGIYKEVFNTDNLLYGGSNQIMGTQMESIEESCNNKPYKVLVKVPPMAVLVIKKSSELIKDKEEVSELLIEEIEEINSKNKKAEVILNTNINIDESNIEVIDSKSKEEN
ncbi:MAG: 1,4-alpha-glucan branching protein GlgB [Clostridium perfringens]|nr:1,4-alpha-glucan branching protein GlgB [Clostridium perfringens]